MNIFPAIDLYEKKAVRLFKGDYDNMTVYSDDPVSVAREFEKQGASYIHVVDLEGARDGLTPNFDVIQQIAVATSLFIETGGGIRTMETIDRYLGGGVSRVILGTAAVKDEALLKAAVGRYGEKIAVGADVRDGYIAVKGWLEQSEFTLEAFFEKMQQTGVKTIICTDISRDGAMKGSNIDMYNRLAASFDLDIIASGGVSSMEDIRKLSQMGLYGAIIGKAYYTGAIDLREAIEVAE